MDEIQEALAAAGVTGNPPPATEAQEVKDVANPPVEGVTTEPVTPTDPSVTQTTEEAPAPETPVEAPKGSVAKAWAEIAKAEAKRKAAAEELKRERFQLQQDMEAVKRVKQENDSIREAFQKDPFAALDKLGVPFKRLAEMAMGQEVPASAAPSSEIAELKAKLEALTQHLTKSREEETLRGRYNQYVQTINTTLAAEKYELLKTHPNATAAVIELANAYAAQTGEILPPDRAADIVMEHYAKRLKETAANKAAAQLLGIASQPATPAPAPEPVKPAATLNSNLGTPPAKGPKDPTVVKKTTHQELMEALALITPR